MVSDRLLTPSKITAWLECGHYLSLRNQVDRGELSVSVPFGSFAQLVLDKGSAHEEACLADYRSRGYSVFEVPGRLSGEPFGEWVERVGDPLADGHDVVFQMPFVNDGIRGIADFLVRVDLPGGRFGYEPVDSKLARTDAKVGHVLQLCFYAEAVQALGWPAPADVHLWLGSGSRVSFPTQRVMPYWERLRGQLARLLDADHDEATEPLRCSHCEFCEFAAHCEQQWRREDSLQLVAGFRVSDIEKFHDHGIDSVESLATAGERVPGVPSARVKRLAAQARLQVEARALGDDATPPFELIRPEEDPTWGHGLEQLPAPDAGDVFLDFEGHPMWRADTGLFFLFGFIAQDDSGGWSYTQMWAHDRTEEAERTRELVQLIANRRAAYPAMHVYHYNHTERSSLERLTADHGVAEALLAGLVESGCFVDLYPVVRNSVQVGVESYGLKYVERLAGFVRSDDIHGGSGAVVDYDAWTRDHDKDRLGRIAVYNEDDVRATKALRDWLVDQRGDGLAWRHAVLDVAESPEGFDDTVAALKAHDVGTTEWFLGDVLGYWLRERRATNGPRIARLHGDGDDLFDDGEFITALEHVGKVERTRSSGKPILPVMRFRFPEQEVDPKLGTATRKVMYPLPDGGFAYGSLTSVDHDAKTVDVLWNEKAKEHGVLPTSVVIDDFYEPGEKVTVINDLVHAVLDPAAHGEPSRVALALLRREPPRFTAGHGPSGGTFDDDVDRIAGLVRHLDHSYLAVQGPPGTGKTYTGSHIIAGLLAAGLRVGICAFSHSAIDNLLEATIGLIAGNGGALPPIARRGKKPPAPLDGVDYPASNAKAADPKYRIVAGTTWCFASVAMRANPVDVLLIDEAGQMSLVDALATTAATRSMVLLGDPLQLAQVAKASHPNGSGASVLEHVLDGDDTVPADRGVFLHETRRMHPDIAAFISERVYDGRLTSHSSCSVQRTASGTGLRWLRAEHSGRSTESPEEAALIHREVARLIGQEWTNQHGESASLTPGDVMVVAPYNRQVQLLQHTLDSDPHTRGVAVGTVDKFQGREAAVVFFSMTASDTTDIPRGSAFLFSQNRLNVAISRARCLAYLVCTDQLLDSRARDTDELQLIANLCAFVSKSAGAPPEH